MSNPLVSIIVPSYNYGHLIIETLTSVVNQTYQNWECIIVDDGSSDGSVSIINNFISAQKDVRFILVPIKNGGTSIAKNTGLQKAQGKYIQFLDADDLISPEKLLVQVAILELQNADLVFSKSRFFTGEYNLGKTVEKYPKNFLAENNLTGTALLEKLIKNNIITIGSPLVKKDLLEKAGLFDPTLKNNEDWQLWFKVAILSSNFVFDADPRSVAEIRIHENSAMNNHSNMFDGEVVVRKFMNQALMGQPLSADINRMKKLNLDLLALHQIRSLNAKVGLKYILSNFAKDPIQEFSTLKMGIFKLAVRFYKNIKNFG